MRHTHIITFTGENRAQLVWLLRYLEQSKISAKVESEIAQDDAGNIVRERHTVSFVTEKNIHFDFRKG